ncbi:MAG: hypothetical protein R3B54_16310 [Bdellovibrionota bacterium]
MELGVRAQWARAAFDLTYGVGVGFISQRGFGQTDTVTSLNVGDSINIAAGWRTFENFGFFAKAQIGAVDLIHRSGGYAANIFLVGVRSFSTNNL